MKKTEKKTEKEKQKKQPKEGKKQSLRTTLMRGIFPFRKALFSRSVQLTRNYHDAQDLLQETYTQAYRHRDKFKEGTNLRAWLYRILFNTYVNVFHRRKKLVSTMDFSSPEHMSQAVDRNDAFHLDRGGFSTTPEGNMVLDDDMRRSFRKLPRKYRIPVLLSDLYDYSYGEVASALGLPRGTVMSRIYRGRKMLEQDLLAFARESGYFRNREPRRSRNDDLFNRE